MFFVDIDVYDDISAILLGLSREMLRLRSQGILHRLCGFV
jgi:hypothetical protein